MLEQNKEISLKSYQILQNFGYKLLMTNDILDTNSLIMNEVKKSKKKGTSKNSPKSYLDMSKDISKA